MVRLMSDRRHAGASCKRQRIDFGKKGTLKRKEVKAKGSDSVMSKSIEVSG